MANPDKRNVINLQQEIKTSVFRCNVRTKCRHKEAATSRKPASNPFTYYLQAQITVIILFKTKSLCIGINSSIFSFT